MTTSTKYARDKDMDKNICMKQDRIYQRKTVRRLTTDGNVVLIDIYARILEDKRAQRIYMNTRSRNKPIYGTTQIYSINYHQSQ